MIVGIVVNNRLYPVDEPGLSNIMPVGLRNEIVTREKEDDRHSGCNITATTALGCPRAFALSRMKDVYVDIEKMWPAQGGSYLHTSFGIAMAAETDREGNKVWWTEEMDEEKCVYVGEVWGRQVGVKIDLLRRDYGAIWDWKTSFKEGNKWVDVDREASPHHSAQLNLARIIVEQNTGMDLSDIEMAAWVMSHRTAKTYCPYMSLEEIGEVKVGWTKNCLPGKLSEGGVDCWTVKECFDAVCGVVDKWQAAAMEEGVEVKDVSDERKERIIRELPLYGERMWLNYKGESSCFSSCPYKWECDNIDGGL